MPKNIIEVIDFIKNYFGLDEDIQVAKMLHLSKIALYNHKRRGTIPYKALFKFCSEHNIPLDEVFGLTTPLSPPKIGGELGDAVAETQAAYGDIPPRLKELFEKLTQIYASGSTDERAKVMGIINAVHDEIERKKESRFQKAQKGESGSPQGEERKSA